MRRVRILPYLVLACLAALVPLRASAQVCDTPPCFIRGDANSDGLVDLADAHFILAFNFTGGPSPSCSDTLDVDDSGGVDLSDPVGLVAYLYLGSPPPPAPFPACGNAQDPLCAYPEAACLGAIALLTEPRYRLGFSLPGVIEGEPGSAVTATAIVELDNSEAPASAAIHGWSLSMRSSDPARVKITGLSIAGTAAGGGERFLTSGAGNEGAVAATIVGIGLAEELAASPIPYALLKLDLEATIPAEGCFPFRLEFRDGLQTSGGKLVENFIVSHGRHYVPHIRAAEAFLCARVEEIEAGSDPRELELPPGGSRLLRLKAETGKTVLLTLSSLDPLSSNALYLRWGALPDATAFDQGADRRLASTQMLVVPSMRAEAAYLLVRNIIPGSDAIRVRLEALAGELFLEEIAGTFGRRGASGRITITATGGGFDAGVSFFLERPGSPLHPAQRSLIVSASRAELSFDLEGLPAGDYNLLAQKDGAAAMLTAAVPVRERRYGPLLEARIEVSPFFRTLRPRRLTIVYRNSGDEEMDAPYFLIAGPPGTQFRLSGDSASAEANLPFVGIHPDGVAGRLPPGGQGTIPVLFQSDRTDGEVRIQLFSLEAEESDLVDWASLPAPPGVSAEEWTAAKDNLELELGASWAAWRRSVSAFATRLSRRGMKASSARELFRAAFREATGRPGSYLLGTVVDADGNPVAREPVAALDALGKARACAQSDVDGNFAAGPLGAGAFRIVLGGHAAEELLVAVDGGDDALHLRVNAGAPSPRTLDCPVVDEAHLPEAPPDLPPAHLREVAVASLRHVRAIDPNEKDGPGDGLVGRGDKITYVIHFENLSTATSAARSISITDTLSPYLDLSTLTFEHVQLGSDPESAGFLAVQLDEAGGHDLFSGYQRSTNRERHSMLLQEPLQVAFPAESPVPLLAEIRTECNASTREVRWTLSTLDPLTGEEPEEPLVGILPPNNKSLRGLASVSFSVRVSAGATPGGTIENHARIWFDDPAAFLDTPSIFNKIRGATETPFVRGDVNDDGSTDISDAIALYSYLFFGGRIPCLDAADANDDGSDNPDISDAIYILGWRFLGTDPPPPPGPDRCGLDPTETGDFMDCLSYELCPP